MNSAPEFADFGRFLASLRVEAGFETQLDLANAIGASQQSVSRWEAGVSRPRASQMPKLADALKVEGSRLLEAAGYALPSAGVVSFAQPFPVERLDPEAFELLVEHVVQARFGGDATIRRSGGRGHTQDGLDVVADFANGTRFSFQCKRVQQFGPADVERAVRAHTAPADVKHLVLSRVASPQTADALRKFPGWTLWDKGDLSRIIRMELSHDQQDRLVDIFFRGQREALLGRPEAGPWLTADEFFEPFASPTSALRHDWELKGRERELADLHKALSGDDRVIMLVGPGGIGKSRLLKEGLERFSAENSGVVVRVLSTATDATPASLESLGTGPKLLVVDDAHDRGSLSGLLHFVARAKNNARLLIATRQYAQLRITREAATLGLVEIPEIRLKPLNAKDTEGLAKEVLRGLGASTELSSRIVQAASDCPLVTVIAARILAQDGRPFERAKNDAAVRNLIMGKFEDIVVGDLGSPADQDRIRSTLDVLALVQPFHIEDPALFQLLQSLKGIDAAEASRLFRLLLEGGVIYRRANQYRLMPDLLADYLIERSCISATRKLSPFALTAFSIVEPGHLTNLLVNLGRLDWRLRDGDPADSMLLESVWRSFSDIKTPYDHRMEAIQSAAVFQPHHALAFVRSQVRRGMRNDRLAGILKSVAHVYESLDEVCEILWALGKDDKRDTNPYPHHPIRVLSELCGFQEFKPLGYSEKVFAFAMRLADRDSEWEHRYTPLDILRPALALEGTTTRDNGRSLSITSYLINYDAVAPLRQQLVERLISLLTHRSAKVAKLAAAAIHDALRIPHSDASAQISTAMLNKYHKEFRGTLNGMQQVLKSGKAVATTIVGIARTVSWHVQHGAPSVRKAAQGIIALIPTDLDFRLRAGMLNASDETLNGRLYTREWHERHEAWLTSLKADLKAAYAPAELREKIEEALSDLLQAQEDPGLSIGLIQHLLKGDVVLAREFIDAVRAKQKSPMRLYLGVALSELLNESPAEGQMFTLQFMDGADPELQFEAVKAIGALRRPPDQTDLQMVESALRSANPVIVATAMRALTFNRVLSQRQVIDLARKANIGASQPLADQLMMIFGDKHDTILDSLMPEDVEHFLARLVPLKELEGHWIKEFLQFVSIRHPAQLLDFVVERTDRAIADDSYTVHALSGGSWMHVPLQLHGAIDVAAFGRLWSWLANHPRRNHYRFADVVGSLFEAIFDGGYGKLVALLETRLETAPAAELQLMGLVLREAENSFVFDHRQFVTRLLERCSELDADLLERVTHELYASATRGVRSGPVGTPMPEDVRQRDKSKEILASLSRMSPAYRLYEMLLESAEFSINHARRSRDAFDDEMAALDE